jgi:hypothetical protein
MPMTPHQKSLHRKALNEDTDYHILCNIASGENTHPDTLHKLALNEDYPKLAERVAKNTNTRPDTLKHLSDNYYTNTRYAVTQNKNTPLDVLRGMGLKHKNMRSYILKRLIKP